MLTHMHTHARTRARTHTHTHTHTQHTQIHYTNQASLSKSKLLLARSVKSQKHSCYSIITSGSVTFK